VVGAYPNRLRSLGGGVDVHVDNDRIRAVTNEDAAEFLVGASVDFLVRDERRYLGVRDHIVA
tara:strand:- start:449 stop:634 length:186 start_codon:yes stop_codon:yes gene_type:complete